MASTAAENQASTTAENQASTTAEKHCNKNLTMFDNVLKPQWPQQLLKIMHQRDAMSHHQLLAV